MRFEFLSSTPPSPTEGSGTWVAIDGVLRGLQRLGHAARLRPITTRTGFHTFDRWRYNRAVVSDPPDADVVIGVDLDGYRWASRRPPGVGYAVMLKGIIADELRNEGGLVRALLTVQARWERVNVRLAERVIVPSRYSAGVAHEVYDVPRERLGPSRSTSRSGAAASPRRHAGARGRRPFSASRACTRASAWTSCCEPARACEAESRACASAS